MPITLTPCLDGSGEIDPAANTYIIISDADAYFALRPNATAWTDLTDDDDKAKLLLWAMRSLQGLGWIGGKLSDTQPLDWPRVAIRPAERISNRTIRTGFETLTGASGGLYDQTGRFWTVEQIPTGVLNAQCEFALAIQQNTALSTPEKYKRKIISDANGTLEWNLGSQSAALNSLAMRELRGLLFTPVGMLATARG